MNELGQSPVRFDCVGVVRRRPPLMEVFFDVDLSNAGSETRWFLIPTKLESSLRLDSAAVDGLDVFELKNQGRVILGRFLGAQEFLALMLPREAHLKIQRLSLRLWNSSPGPQVLIETLIARDLTIGEDSAADWFGFSPESDLLATVVADQGKLISERRAPDGAPVPIHILEERRIRQRVDIRERAM